MFIPSLIVTSPVCLDVVDGRSRSALDGLTSAVCRGAPRPVAGRRGLHRRPQRRPDGALEQRVARALAPLAELLAREREVRAALLHHAELDAVVEEIRRRVDARPPADVELGLPERARASLFLTIFTRVRDPTLSSLTLTGPMRRTSRRTLA